MRCPNNLHMNIYIANLDSAITDDNLRKLFSGYGEVRYAEIMHDVFSGESRGFGYVEMLNEKEAEKAIHSLNNTELNEFTITVKPEESGVVYKEAFRKEDPDTQI